MPDIAPAFANRLLPARPDLAAAWLRGRVASERFVEGSPHRVTAALLDLTMRPGGTAERATQLLFGENFTVYEMQPDGFAWGQAALDGYVGYVSVEGLGPETSPGQPVTALWSQVYAAPKVRARTVAELPMLARVPVLGHETGFSRLESGGYVPSAHFGSPGGDVSSQAERFMGVPYLWGGRSARGLDCSALVQLALMALSAFAPRDSDMQQAELGRALQDNEALQRNDLVFWNGHVGVMRDADTLLHANAHHMAVASEPLKLATARINANGGGEITCRKRLD